MYSRQLGKTRLQFAASVANWAYGIHFAYVLEQQSAISGNALRAGSKGLAWDNAKGKSWRTLRPRGKVFDRLAQLHWDTHCKRTEELVRRAAELRAERRAEEGVK